MCVANFVGGPLGLFLLPFQNEAVRKHWEPVHKTWELQDAVECGTIESVPYVRLHALGTTRLQPASWQGPPSTWLHFWQD